MFLYFRWSRIYRGQCKKWKKSSRGMASAFKSRQHRWLNLKKKYIYRSSKKNFSWNCHHHYYNHIFSLKKSISVLLYTRIGCVILMMCNISFTVITPHTQLSCLFMLFSRVFLSLLMYWKKLVKFHYLFCFSACIYIYT